MRLSKTLAIGVLAALSMGEMATAHNAPPLDRPTPPPCCADGICYPNPITWGVYPTRWRRWPGVVDAALEPSPAPEPGELGPAVPPFAAPPAEEEDRRAPPPTQRRRPPAAPPTEEGAEPGAQPTAPTEGGPSPSPFETGPATGPSLEESPPEREVPTMPWDEPTSDADPPPAPPFATLRRGPVNTLALQPAMRSVPTRTNARGQSPATNDPPPSLPLALSDNGF